MPLEGWLCPKCGSAHAPDVKTCPVSVKSPPGLSTVPLCEKCGLPNTHCGCFRPTIKAYGPSYS